jgi:hypothetical protein
MSPVQDVGLPMFQLTKLWAGVPVVGDHSELVKKRNWANMKEN